MKIRKWYLIVYKDLVVTCLKGTTDDNNNNNDIVVLCMVWRNLSNQLSLKLLHLNKDYWEAKLLRWIERQHQCFRSFLKTSWDLCACSNLVGWDCTGNILWEQLRRCLIVIVQTTHRPFPICSFERSKIIRGISPRKFPREERLQAFHLTLRGTVKSTPGTVCADWEWRSGPSYQPGSPSTLWNVLGSPDFFIMCHSPFSSHIRKGYYLTCQRTVMIISKKRNGPSVTLK